MSEDLSSAAARVGDILRGVSAEPEKEEAAQNDPNLTDDSISQLSELMSGEKPADAGEGGDDGEPEKAEAPTPDAKPSDLGAAAEKLGMTPDELYKLAIPMPGEGEPVTLGELKDQALKWQRETLDREEFQNTKVIEQQKLADAREELATLVQMLPPEARNPQMLERSRKQIEEMRTQELQKLLVRVPEWKDAATYQADREVMEPHLAQFGFQAGELDSVYDARLLAYIRHNSLREQRLASMVEQMKAGRKRDPSSATAGKRKAAKESKRPTQNASIDQTVMGVREILKG